MSNQHVLQKVSAFRLIYHYKFENYTRNQSMRRQVLKLCIPLLIGFSFMYCLNEDLPLNFIIISSIFNFFFRSKCIWKWCNNSSRKFFTFNNLSDLNSIFVSDIELSTICKLRKILLKFLHVIDVEIFSFLSDASVDQ